MADEEKSSSLDDIEKLLEGLETDFSEIRGDKKVTSVTSVTPPSSAEKKPSEPPAKETAPQPPAPEVPPAEIPEVPQEPVTPTETIPPAQKEEPASLTDELLSGLEEPFETQAQQPELEVPPAEIPEVPQEPVTPTETIPPAQKEEPASLTDELLSGLEEFPPTPPAPETVPEMEPTLVEQPQAEQPQAEQPQAEQPQAEQPKEEEFQISDEDAIKIQKKISTLSPELKKIVKQSILKEDLPKPDLNTLLRYLINNAPEVEIKKFIESKKGIKVKAIVPPLYHPPITRKIKPGIFDIIKHDFYPILRLAVGVALIFLLLYIPIIGPSCRSHKANSLINEGVKRIDKDDINNFNIAEKYFEQANQLKKNFYESYIKYGKAYVGVKNFSRAEDKYLALQKINPEYIQVYFALGDMYQKEMDYKRAIKNYKIVLQYDKNNIDALDKIARVYYYRLNNKEKALEIYNKIIENEPDNIQAHYGLLSIYIWNEDLDNVEREHYLDNIEREHYQVLKLGVKKQRGRHSKILGLRIGPRKKYYIDKKRLTELADFYIDFQTDNIAKKEDLLLKAEDTIKRILDNDEKYSDAYYEYAKLNKKRKDYKNAIRNLNEAISEKKNDARYYNLLGEIYSETGKFNLAIDAFETSMQVNPNFYKAYYNLGNINFYKLDNYAEAMELYSTASEKLKDKYPDLSYNLGWIYYNDNNYIEANKRFTDALESAPTDDPILHYAMGNTFLKLQKYELATDQYLNAIDYFREKYGEHPKINIENKDMVKDMNLLSVIYNNLGVSYLYNNNEKQALVYFWKAIESAKKLGYSNEIPQARVNIQYVLKKSPGMNEPAVFNELPKELKINEKSINF